MADAPRLNSATDAAARYAPLSGVAVTAVAVAGVFVIALVLTVAAAVSSGQPVLNEWVIAPAVLGVVLAFLGRRHVLTSEGARTGATYAVVAWWVCVVGGGCYAAYWLATDLAVRADAEKAMAGWTADLAQGNPADPADPKVRAAFATALDPGARSSVTQNPRALHTQWAVPYAQFRDGLLVQLPARYRDTARIESKGLRSWELSADGKLRCDLAATLTCPEGEFPFTVPLVGVKAADGKSRVWQVEAAKSARGFKFLDPAPGQSSRTRYGWLVLALQASAQTTAGRFFDTLKGPPPLGQSAAVAEFVTGRLDPAGTRAAFDTAAERLALVGPAAVMLGPTDPGDAFFTRTDGRPLTDDKAARPDGVEQAGRLRRMREVWGEPRAARIGVAGQTGFVAAEQAADLPTLDLSDPARVRVRVPVEFVPLPEDRANPLKDEYYRAKGTYTTGWLVLELTDPQALKQLADARAAGDRPSAQAPADLQAVRFPLKVVRLESDLVPITPPQPSQTASAPGPGGIGG